MTSLFFIFLLLPLPVILIGFEDPKSTGHRFDGKDSFLQAHEEVSMVLSLWYPDLLLAAGFSEGAIAEAHSKCCFSAP